LARWTERIDLKYRPSKWFHAWTLLTVLVGVILIWWGAAVTTEDVGLSVPDWPLCFGRINPEGWWKVPALLLEHGHRWLGATIGILVLIAYLWVFAKERPRMIEAVGIVLVSLGYFYLIYSGALKVATVIAALGLVWLVLTWRVAHWSLLRGLSTLALVLVVVQASLGGLRVLKMSDPFGILHGTLGQVFFCVLVLMAFASSWTWRNGQSILREGRAFSARFSSTILFGAVFMQLVIGAVLRHTQRDHLAASDLLTTQGHWIPPVTPADAFVLFVHKYWGVTVALIVLAVARHARGWVDASSPVRWIPSLLSWLPLVQVGLGISVIMTGKSFWVTNFHVLNGLALLALACMLMAAAWSGARSIGDVAEGVTDRGLSAV
jgi:cytochrome c oxidase assembly protein subunit 15